MTRSNPCLFVVGCPRSGTTLLQRMLDAHPLLAVANDTHFIARAVSAVAPDWRDEPGALEAADARLREWSRAYRRFPRLGLDDAAVERAAVPRDGYARFVGRLYDELAALRAKPFAGEKTPDYVSQLPLLHTLFPEARFIHIVRDGRDVALSLLEWATPTKGPGRIPLWSRDPMAVCALWWQRGVEAGRRDGAELGAERYLEVRYEDLVASPERGLREIANFLDLPFAAEMLTFNRGRERRDSGLSAKSAWLGPTSGLRDWRQQMDAENIELFEALAGTTLGSAGYARQVLSPSADAGARAQHASDWWNEYLRAKERKRRRSSVGARTPQVKDHGYAS